MKRKPVGRSFFTGLQISPFFGLSIFFLAGLLFLATSGLPLRTSSLVRIPPKLGNRPSIIEHLASYRTDRSISFAVVGDTKSFGTFEAIFEKLRELNLDFIVNLGDFVREPTPWEHRYFVREMGEDLDASDPPMLLVAGNHDVDPRRFSISAFESLYGPSNFAFVCAGNLFVILNNATRGRNARIERLSYLEKVLSRKRKEARRVFILMHKPPINPDHVTEHVPKNRFMRLMACYRVDYVLCSHLHRYARVQVGPTTVLITGGGGARLDPEAVDAFHHAVIFRLRGDSVSEQVLAVPATNEPLEKLEHFLDTRLIPKFQAIAGVEEGS